METNIQADALSPKNHDVIDLTGSPTNGSVSLRDTVVTRVDQDPPDPLTTQTCHNGYSVCNKETLRQTMLNQALIFRNQVQELHRVHKRQVELMNEVKTRNVKNAPIPTLDSVSNKHLEPPSNGIDRGLPLCVGVRSEMTRNERLSDGYAGCERFQGRRADEQFGTREINPAKSPMLFGSPLIVPRNEISQSQVQTVESLGKKRKIFGVEISEANNDSRNAASNLPTTLENDDPGNCKGGLPWFHKSTPHDSETSKGVERPYFMNIDSLRNCSGQFFTKSETGSQSSARKHDISAPMDVNEIKKDENDARKQLKTSDLTYESNSRYQIDLNLSLDDGDVLSAASLPTAVVMSAPSLPTAVAKTATTEIALEAPVGTESIPEPDEFVSTETEVHREKLEISSEELDKSVADNLISMSLTGVKNTTDNVSCKLTEAISTELHWFAEFISSQGVNSANESKEDSAPEGMDSFEVMTLQLEDVKDDLSSYNRSMALTVKRNEKMRQGGQNSMALNVKRNEKMRQGGQNSMAMNDKRNEKVKQGVRNSKGPKKRAVQKKNFKKDVLQGLGTLSRQELKEDLKTFDDLCKGKGQFSKSKNSAKKGSSSSAVSLPGLGVMAGSLIRWGGSKRQRMPRNRCRAPRLLFAV